ncbi:hypothetical protein [Porcipelethomonas sp.]|jgi:hypothetical protein|uniref:hypothetical protein n=1 Tax=Porcipelethomonas sp. TaxID=2981675 RepID=UPI0030780DDA
MINYILAFDMLKAAPQNQRLMTSSVRQYLCGAAFNNKKYEYDYGNIILPE